MKKDSDNPKTLRSLFFKKHEDENEENGWEKDENGVYKNMKDYEKNELGLYQFYKEYYKR